MRKEDIVLLDGAVGTSLWEKTESRQPVWQFNLENPGIVMELVNEYVDAGARIVLANTFGANRLAVKRTSYSVQTIVSEGVRLAKEAAASRAKIALAVGPLPVLLEPYGDLTEDEAYEIFDEQISAGMSQKPDYIMLQTFLDANMMHIAGEAAAKWNLPIISLLTFTEIGKTIMGHSVEYFVDVMKDIPLAAIGINCSLGPEKAVPIIASFRQYTDLPLCFKPNAGKPILQDGEEKTQYDIPTFIRESLPALDHDVTYIGGCCGCNAAYIRALREAISNYFSA